jgi:hypothetical protein
MSWNPAQGKSSSSGGYYGQSSVGEGPSHGKSMASNSSYLGYSQDGNFSALQSPSYGRESDGGRQYSSR